MQIEPAGDSRLIHAIHCPGGLHASLEPFSVKVQPAPEVLPRPDSPKQLSGSTAKTRPVKPRAKQSPTVARLSSDQNSWPDTPPAYQLSLAEGSPRDPSSIAPCRSNPRYPCAPSSDSSACDKPGSIPLQSASPLLLVTPPASVAEWPWLPENQTTRLQRAQFPPRAH